jgi:nucleotide-binding universal stress UspA family protein
MTSLEGKDVSGPILFAFDGSELATAAIARGAELLATGRAALVLCVWQPVDVGFVPSTQRHFDADEATEVRSAAEETAAYGASLAERGGFQTQSLAVEAAPTWKGIVTTASDRDASLIVLGSHCRRGLAGHLLGSVAGAVVAHATCSVFVVHE